MNPAVKVKVSRWRKWTKYYIVIPKKIVQQLGIKKGDQLEITVSQSRIIFEKRKNE